MASRSKNTPCIIKSREQRVLAKWFASLLEAVTPMIDELTAQLYSAEFIERATKNDDTGTPYQKATRVLRCVEISVDRNPRKFHQFLDVLDLFSTLSDIAQSMRQSCTTVTPRVQDTIGGHSKLGSNTDVKEHPFHTQRQPPEQVEKVVDELSELQLSCSPQSKPIVASSFTDGSSGVFIPCVEKYDQGSYVSNSATVRLGHDQMVPLVTVAVPEEEGSFVPFHRNMSGGVPFITEKNIVAAMDDRSLSTVEEKTPIQSSDCLEMNFSSISSISSLSCDSRPTSMTTDSELDEKDRLLDCIKETVDAYHEVHKQEKKKIHSLNKKLEEKENRLKHKENKMSKLITKLKLTQEVASEKSEQCDKLTEDITLMKSQIQLLERQLISTKNERKRLNEELEEVDRQHWKLLRKYKQLLAEKDDGYYDKYREAMKENKQLHEQLEEHKKEIERLQEQVDYLLGSDPVDDSLEGHYSAEDSDRLGDQEDEPPDSTVTIYGSDM